MALTAHMWGEDLATGLHWCLRCKARWDPKTDSAAARRVLCPIPDTRGT